LGSSGNIIAVLQHNHLLECRPCLLRKTWHEWCFPGI